MMQAHEGGRGVNMQRVEYPMPRDGMPQVKSTPGGRRRVIAAHRSNWQRYSRYA